MFETLVIEGLGLEELSPRTASVWFGLALGIGFGTLAFATGFCLRRGLVGAPSERLSAMTTWLWVLSVALIGTQALGWLGVIEVTEHRLLSAQLPLLQTGLGGALFGAGMVLTRGCLSRLTVLSGSGNLRALTVLGVAALVALATQKGVLAPLRTALAGYEIEVTRLPQLFTFLPLLITLFLLIRTRLSASQLVLSALLGVLVPLGWLGTGLLLQDEFDPIAVDSLSFTGPWADSLFWSVASSSITAGFGTGLIGGVILGGLVLSLITRRFQWQGFEHPAQMGRYLVGGALMGFGGVLAGGCTVGAGLSGLAILSTTALFALAAIITGALIMDRVVLRAVNARSSGGSGAPSPKPAPQPAA
ncbi:YeeE/YedE family protein [Aliiroseovarius crassostreae]|uniref:YeeE/YedE family protein n=1 Tax=Aliiroseovarius crassostreae TaxID=154981 RepID=UPI0021FE9B74|nr:YeeE/YedE family protein [Aliiroseovarius crassostreae]UWP91133.1 YeeE/YedE family protein [Aliiroseovarius crassostreae]